MGKIAQERFFHSVVHSFTEAQGPKFYGYSRLYHDTAEQEEVVYVAFRHPGPWIQGKTGKAGRT